MSATCATCRYAGMAVVESGPVVECHRFPPAPDLGSALLDPPADDPKLIAEHAELSIEVGQLDRYPVVRETDWCGEFALPEDQDLSHWRTPWAAKIEPGTLIVLPKMGDPADPEDDFCGRVSRAIEAVCGHADFVIIWADLP